MSMAASLEARVPYLDNHVVTLAESMPDTLKLRGQTTKYLLKMIARKLLPTSITDRAKHGFELPLSEWIRGVLGSHFTGLIMDGSLQKTGLFGQTYIVELLNAHQQLHADHSHRIWLLGNLSLWLDKFRIKI